jgi:hypothetical protein
LISGRLMMRKSSTRLVRPPADVTRPGFVHPGQVQLDHGGWAAHGFIGVAVVRFDSAIAGACAGVAALASGSATTMSGLRWHRLVAAGGAASMRHAGQRRRIAGGLLADAARGFFNDAHVVTCAFPGLGLNGKG